MDLSTIRAVNAKHAAAAAQERREPMFIACEEDARRIPFIGDYEPPGWQRVHTLFVDKSGYGQRDEPALTLAQFIEQVQPDLAYAVIEEGPFQVYIGAYERR